MTNLKEGQQIKILAVKWIQLKHMKTIKSHLEAALVCSRLWVPRHPCVCTTVWLKFRLSRSGGGHFSAAWLWLPQSPLKVLRHSMNEFHFQEIKFSKTSQYFQNCKLHQWAYLEGYNCLFFFTCPPSLPAGGRWTPARFASSLLLTPCWLGWLSANSWPEAAQAQDALYNEASIR